MFSLSYARTRAVEMCFLRRMLKISWTEKKSNLEVRRAAGVQRTLMMTIRQRQLDFFGHVMRSQGLEALVITGKVEGRRARGRQRQKYLDSLCTYLEDNVSPTQLIRATEDRLLWHDMVANVVNDDIRRRRRTNQWSVVAGWSRWRLACRDRRLRSHQRCSHH